GKGGPGRGGGGLGVASLEDGDGVAAGVLGLVEGSVGGGVELLQCRDLGGEARDAEGAGDLEGRAAVLEGIERKFPSYALGQSAGVGRDCFRTEDCELLAADAGEGLLAAQHWASQLDDAL